MFPPVLVPADAAAGTRATTAEEGVVGVVDLCGGLCKVFEERSRCRLNASADKNFAMIFDVHLSGHQSFNFQSRGLELPLGTNLLIFHDKGLVVGKAPSPRVLQQLNHHHLDSSSP